MKTTKADFEYFKKRYLFHVGELGINHYELRLKHEDVEDAYATTEVAVEDKVAVVTLSTDWTNGDGRKVTRRDLDITARHEALHLLCGKLAHLAGATYSKGVVNEAEEELIRTLETYMDGKR